MQKGHIYRKGDIWMFRYWTYQSVDGRKVRKQAAKRLAPFCDRYRTIKSVRPLADDILRPVNSERESSGSRTSSIFYRTSLPSLHKRAQETQSYKGYENIYRLHIASRVAGLRVQDYRTVDTQRLFDAIAADKPRMSHTTFLHIKGFLSGVFSVAKRLGAYDGENPVRDTAVPKGRASKETHAYSLSEIEAMIAALDNETHRTAVIVAALQGSPLVNCAVCVSPTWAKIKSTSAHLTGEHTKARPKRKLARRQFRSCRSWPRRSRNIANGILELNSCSRA